MPWPTERTNSSAALLRDPAPLLQRFRVPLTGKQENKVLQVCWGRWWCIWEISKAAGMIMFLTGGCDKTMGVLHRFTIVHCQNVHVYQNHVLPITGAKAAN